MRRHKVPFAGALRVIPVDGLTLTPTDPRYLHVAQSRRDLLDRRFESIRSRLAEVLTLYMSPQPAGAARPPGADEVKLSHFGL